MSIGAFATLERTSAVMLYLDVILVLIVAVPASLLGAPMLGYAVGGAAWTVGRIASTVVEKRVVAIDDVRRKIGLGLASSMFRVWVLAGAIIAAGVASSRADGLTAGLVIFGAFSVYFVRSSFGLMMQQRGSTNR